MSKYTFILIFTLFAVASQSIASTPAKKSICLNMIVKNESPVIERCLQSVLPIIDSWVIVDTGSTDGTQQVIKKFLKDIPGELHERPWVNFGHNRQEALLLAKNKADYILFMDADDILVFAKDFQMPDLTHDFYVIPTHSNGLECLLPRLVNSKRDWEWEGVLHEYIRSEGNAEGIVINGVEYVYISDGARAKDPKRYEKDIKILKEALQKDPNNSRNVFYLAKSYQMAGDFENAIKSYQQSAEMGGFPEEIFSSKLDIARIQQQLKLDPAIVEASYIDAYKFRPSRAEPLYYIVNQACRQENYQKGYDIAKLAVNLPSVDTLFVEKWIYDYGLHFHLAFCAYHLQKYSESLDIFTKILALPQLPENYRKDAQHLRQKAYEQIQLANKNKIIDVVQNH